jgi:hypothetical protein
MLQTLFCSSSILSWMPHLSVLSTCKGYPLSYALRRTIIELSFSFTKLEPSKSPCCQELVWRCILSQFSPRCLETPCTLRTSQHRAKRLSFLKLWFYYMNIINSCIMLKLISNVIYVETFSVSRMICEVTSGLSMMKQIDWICYNYFQI